MACAQKDIYDKKITMSNQPDSYVKATVEPLNAGCANKLIVGSRSMLFRRCYFALLLFTSEISFGQQQQQYNLASLLQQGKLQAVNRDVVYTASPAYIKISQQEGEGIVWLPIDGFESGSIEIAMRGKDVFQQSFIGVAFHGLNDSTYDAVYCRPFNFFAKDSVRRIHAIQYISHPVYTWKKLRAEQNAVYEKEILLPPGPNEWFTMKLVIDATTISAFINGAALPSLQIQKLSDRQTGRIGLYTADSSGGDFKSISIGK